MSLLDKIKNLFKAKGNALVQPDEQAHRVITAYHEAAHFVVAYLSSYHFLQGQVILIQHDSGLTTVTLSSKKLQNAGKDPSLTSANDFEITVDVIKIYYAGLEAEKIYCKANHYILDESYSKNDLFQISQIEAALPIAIQAKSKELIVKQTREIINRNWSAIEDVAKKLLSSLDGKTDVVDLIEMLDIGYQNNSFFQN